MSRRDQLFQAVDAVQGRVLNLIDNHVEQSRRPGPSAAGPSSSQQTGANPGRANSVVSTAPPPLYQHQSEPGSEPVPESVLRAPPGQAQMAVDQMPRNRMTRGTGREARQAAALLREEQLRTGQLKTRHTFVSSSGRVLLDVHTVPQKHLTFMGGTAQRGQGAMSGVVVLNAQPNERVSSIRLKIKAVANVLVPRNSTAKEPFLLEKSHPQVEPCVEKELLLLQLETQLYSAAPNSRNQSDPTLLTPGKHEFPFTIELPAETVKGNPLPPSFVLMPQNTPDQVVRPQPTSKWEALQTSINIPNLRKEWASVKWYAKLTVERPGMLRTNDRIFAPFVYLPPPPKFRGAEEHLLRRHRLANEVDALLLKFKQNNATRPLDLQRLIEPFSSWDTFRLNYGVVGRNPKKIQAANTKADKPSMFSKLMFGAQVETPAESETANETWTLSLPGHPFVFALRSGVPYILSRRVEWKGRGQLSADRLTRAPNVAIYQRTNLYARGKGPVAGTTARFVCAGHQPADRTPVAVTDGQLAPRGSSGNHRQVEHWLGIVDLPPSCVPCFETPIVTLDYYLGVKSPSTGDLLHCEPIVLACPPSKPIRTPPRPAITMRPPSTKVSRPSSGRTSANNVNQRPTPAVPMPTIVSPSAIAVPGRHQVPPMPVAYPPHPPPQVGPQVSRPVAGPSRIADNAPQQAIPRPVPNRPLSEKAPRPEASERRPSATSSSGHGHGNGNVVPSQIAYSPPSRAQTPALPASAGTARFPASAMADPITPSRANTPNIDQSGAENGSDDQHDPNQWSFVDDELTDLPPSYFEATGQRDDD